MRWPIWLQLLLPMLAVVVLAIVLASAASAYLGAVRLRSQQEDDLRRVVGTLADSSFPLTENVLRQTSGLSGAEFVLLDREGNLRQSTLRLLPDDLAALRRQPAPADDRLFSSNPAVAVQGREYLVERVGLEGRPPYISGSTLYVLYPEDRWTARARQAVYPAITSGLVAALLAVGVATVLARRIVRPLHDLVDRTAAVARGSFAPIPMPPRNDELADLIQSINRMAQRLAQYEDEVRRNERLRTLGQLGAGMAHQLRNAATGGRIAIEFHRRDCPREPGDESLEVAMRQLRLMESYLQRFLALGKPPSEKRQRVAVATLIREAAALVGPACSHAGIELCCEPGAADLTLVGNGENLQQLLANLLLNAAEAAGTSGAAAPVVSIAAERRSAARGAIVVRDTGPGPSPEIAARLFEPFATSKPDGVGLGLYVARQIAEAHGGSLDWRREDGATLFWFEFPLHEVTDHGAPADRG